MDECSTKFAHQIDHEKLKAFSERLTAKFGENALWASLFLIMQIDKNTWTFPEYVLATPIKDIAKFIEQDDEIREVFQ